MIPYGRQCISQNDIDNVIDVLKSDFLTQGPQVPIFEKELCLYTSAKHAIAVNSATSALHIACKALGLSTGDWLWTTPISFVASSNCGLYCGAKIDFIDIDPHTYNLSSKSLEEKLIIAEKHGKLPKILVAVHLSGQSCDMQEINKLSKKYGFKIIEDASHAIGGKYKNNPIGSCIYSDVTIFSFHPVKIITTAEGGVALTNNSELAKKMTILRSHGITRAQEEMKNQTHGKWYYEQIDLGHNYRMTELQAALGISQLKSLENYIKKRHEIANVYFDKLSKLPLMLPKQKEECHSSFHLYIIRLKMEKIKKNKKVIFDELLNEGIGVNLHYIPIYKHPYYQNLGFSYNYCSEAEKYYKEAISIPLYPTLKAKEQNHVINSVKRIISP